MSQFLISISRFEESSSIFISMARSVNIIDLRTSGIPSSPGLVFTSLTRRLVTFLKYGFRDLKISLWSWIITSIITRNEVVFFLFPFLVVHRLKYQTFLN